MQAAPARCVSVSELYSTDEVELLLDEIRDLEPTSCRGEDVQDFEIAGSGFGVGGACGAGGAGGGRSPAGTELTERSWDSHAHYSRAPPPRPRRLAPLYCRWRALCSLHALTQILIVVCSVSACVCVWSVCGARVWLLPLSGRVRLLLCGAVSAALAHAALLFARVTRLHALLPVPWRALRAGAALCAGAALAAGGAATLHAVLCRHEYRHATEHVAHTLIAAAALGVCGACASFLIVGLGVRAALRGHRRALAAAGASGAGAAGAGAARLSAGSLRAAYRAVPAHPPPSCPPPAPAPRPAPHPHPHPQPSTSRDNQL